jgi:hypothetical protein
MPSVAVFEIVRTYQDGGKSGLSLKGRESLRQLIADVCGGTANFNTILVYDVSRWGRFQDADESAHYEFPCRSAGIKVEYCAEMFDNDGLLQMRPRLMPLGQREQEIARPCLSEGRLQSAFAAQLAVVTGKRPTGQRSVLGSLESFGDLLARRPALCKMGKRDPLFDRLQWRSLCESWAQYFSLRLNRIVRAGLCQ